MPRPRAKRFLLSIPLGAATSILLAWTFRLIDQIEPTRVGTQPYTLSENEKSWTVRLAHASGRSAVIYSLPLAGKWQRFRESSEPSPLPLLRESRWAASFRCTGAESTAAWAYGWPAHALKAASLDSVLSAGRL